MPVRDADGSLRISTPATQPILDAFATRKYFSVEFLSLCEIRTKSGTREITLALVDGRRHGVPILSISPGNLRSPGARSGGCGCEVAAVGEA